jgi:hypothetical protein
LFPFCQNELAPGKSPVKDQPEVLDILGELHVVYMDRGAHFSSCGECDMVRLGSVSFYFSVFNSFGLHIGWFAVFVKHWLDHCTWLMLHYHRQMLLR